MSDIVAECTYCKNDISDTDFGVIHVRNRIYCSSWCAQKDTNEKLKTLDHLSLKSPSALSDDDS